MLREAATPTLLFFVPRGRLGSSDESSAQFARILLDGDGKRAVLGIAGRNWAVRVLPGSPP